MIIETKYNFGDRVWKIQHEHVKQWEPCVFCGGKKRITGADGTTILCPQCYGDGGKYEYRPQKWQVDYHQLTIGQIQVKHVCESEGFDPDSMFDNYGPQEDKREEYYMCYETGIGSGTMHPVETLWPTKEEAQAECDRLNAQDEEAAS